MAISIVKFLFTVQIQPAGGRGRLFGRVIRLQFAGLDSEESLESGLFLAVSRVVGHGAFFPAPFGGLLADGAGGAAAIVCPYAKGRFEGTGRA